MRPQVKGTIVICKSPRAIKPEIYAYRDFLTAHGYEVRIQDQCDTASLADADVAWHFPGIDRVRHDPGRIKIHEYTHLSIHKYPLVRRLKNTLKRMLNPRPDLRVFMDEGIRRGYGFTDGVPYVYRGMGVADVFFDVEPSREPVYDFVYTGSMEPNRGIDRLLLHIGRHMPDHSLLLVGFLPPSLEDLVRGFDNIHATGSVPYEKVPGYLAQARYGVNYVIERIHMQHHTSTKLLEYAAAGLRIISTDYPWARKFAQKHGGKFHWIREDLAGLDAGSLNQQVFVTPDVSAYRWEKILLQSNLLETLDALLA